MNGCYYRDGDLCRRDDLLEDGITGLCDFTRTYQCCIFHKPTNADRIRSMTDEKLAELLRDYQCNTCDFSGFCEETDKCKEKIFEWLRQEYTP